MAPILQPTAGRPNKKRKKRITKKSAKKAISRKLKRQLQKKNNANRYERKDMIDGVEEEKISRRKEYTCSQCGQKGHTVLRCRARTDGRGSVMSIQEQQAENKK